MQLGPRAMGRRFRPKSGELAGVPGGKGVGEVEGLTRARFEARVGVEGRPAMVGGDTRRRRSLELLSRRPPGLGKEKGGAVGFGRGREGMVKLWPVGGGPDSGALHGRDGGLVVCARTAGCSLYRRAAFCLSDEGTPALTPQYDYWPRQAHSAWGARDGPLVTTALRAVATSGAARGRGGRARVLRLQARWGHDGSGLEVVGPGPRGSRGGARAAHGAGQTGRAPDALAAL
jgi:hypothetical protein